MQLLVSVLTWKYGGERFVSDGKFVIVQGDWKPSRMLNLQELISRSSGVPNNRVMFPQLGLRTPRTAIRSPSYPAVG